VISDELISDQFTENSSLVTYHLSLFFKEPLIP
jgi:hypothetical protein